jgi:hypothetical protein
MNFIKRRSDIPGVYAYFAKALIYKVGMLTVGLEIF